MSLSACKVPIDDRAYRVLEAAPKALASFEKMAARPGFGDLPGANGFYQEAINIDLALIDALNEAIQAYDNLCDAIGVAFPS